MKLLFVYDAPFYKEGDNIYTADSLPSNVWGNNYLPYFENITIISRYRLNKKHKNSLSSLDDGRITFNLILEYSPGFSFIKRFLLSFNKIKTQITKAIKETDVTIVRLPSLFGFIAISILKKYKKPHLIEVVAFAKESYIRHGSLAGKICGYFFEWLTKKYIESAENVLYVAKMLQKRYPTSGYSEIISDVIIENILKPEEININRFTGERFKIGLIGALSVRFKGQDVLMKAITKLEPDIRKNIELYFVGFGDDDWIVTLAKELGLSENIKFTASLPRNNIFDFLKTMSLYVQPSFMEGMPRSLLEAMSMGCPVLASNIGGIPEVLDSDLLHNPGDYNAFSNQIERFYNDREYLKNEALRSLEIVKPFLKNNLEEKRRKFFAKAFSNN
jgi:glycosyltransferase involved in cell wall biosynthesis